jgi:hypothetical protein
MMERMDVMSVGSMRMVCCFFVLTRVMMMRRLLMVTCSVLVVLSRLPMMLSRIF